MHESTLTKLSLLMAIIGIIGLYIISDFSKDNESIKLGELRETNNKITLYGQVNRVTETNTTTFLKVSRQIEEELDVVIFEPIQIQKGSYVKITGRKQTYKGQEKIVADEVYVG